MHDDDPLAQQVIGSIRKAREETALSVWRSVADLIDVDTTGCETPGQYRDAVQCQLDFMNGRHARATDEARKRAALHVQRDELDRALASVHKAIAFDVTDYSTTKRLAWIYGILVGWDDESLEELARRYPWARDRGEVARLKGLRASVAASEERMSRQGPYHAPGIEAEDAPIPIENGGCTDGTGVHGPAIDGHCPDCGHPVEDANDDD